MPVSLVTSLPPNGINVPATSNPACGTAVAAEIPKSAGKPSAALRSTLVPNCCTAEGISAPLIPPIMVPTPGATAEPAIAPRRAPPSVAARLGACSAIARGTWRTISLAPPISPFSLYTFLSKSSPVCSAYLPDVSRLRRNAAAATSSGSPVKASNVVCPLDNNSSAPRLTAAPIPFLSAGAACGCIPAIACSIIACACSGVVPSGTSKRAIRPSGIWKRAIGIIRILKI